MAEFVQGAVVAGCRIEGIIGRGGMGVVYRATQLSLDRLVAFKAIAPEFAADPIFRRRFQRESRVAASIEHPNVIPVYEAGEGDGVLYLTMRYVEGTDLRALIDSEGGLEPERATRLVAQVAAALAAAHRRDLIHRDVKPANVLIAGGEDQEHAYLTDFGIARHSTATTHLTRAGAVIGTLDYLAPERIQAEGGDGRADLYALGCVLFEALTGTRPYPRDNDVAKMYAHLNAPVPSVRELRPGVGSELDELARRAMAKAPEDRFATAGAMAEALADTLTPPTRPRAAPPPPEPSALEEEADAQLQATEPDMPALDAPTAPSRAAPLGFSEEVDLAEGTAEEELSRLERAEGRSGAPAVADRGEEQERPREPERPQGPKPRRRRPPVLVLLGAALVAAVAAVLALVALGGGEESTDAPRGEAPKAGAPGPPAFSAADRIDIPPGTDGMAVGLGRVWIANKQTNTITPLDESTGELGQPIDVGTEPDSVAVGFGAVWVTNARSQSVTRLDPETGDTQDIDVGPGPEGIAVSERAVWVANGEGGSVTRIAPDSLARTTEAVGRGPVQIAVTDDDRVWVTLSDAGRVVELERESGEPTGATAEVPGQPRGIAFGADRLWVSALQAGRLAFFSPEVPGDVRQLAVPKGPREVRYGLGAVWVNSSGPGTLTAIDPATAREIDRFEVGAQNYGLAVSDRFAWSASLEDGRLLKVRSD